MYHTRFVLIPSFIERALTARGAPFSNILEFDKISKFLAINDIALLARMQGSDFTNLVLTPFGTNNPTDQVTCVGVFADLMAIWNEKISSDFQTTLSNVVTVASLEQTKQDVLERVFNIQRYNDSDEAFRIVDIQPGVCGVVITPGAFPNPRNAKNAIDKFMKAALIYEPIEEIANTSLFTSFIKTCEAQ